jgi:pyruvate/2-oxoglutarate dehydrogenase complex dihydrolipoamide dehydrogenase (E3) component
MAEQYDAIVVGSGQAAGQLCDELVGAGRRTVLVERVHLGGTCINEGCTPTKTMVASARVAYLARRAADYGVRTGPVSVDLARVRQRKRDIVTSFGGGFPEGRPSTKGLELVKGEARFVGPKELAVRLNAGGERVLAAELIFLNVGARPTVPSIPGLAELGPDRRLDSTSIMELGEVPEHLIVLGGGYVGLEFGQMFRRFGSRVTIVQRGKALLSREDADVAEAVAAILREDGVEVLLETQARRVASTSAGLTLTVAGPSGERTIDGTHLLVAVGRTPNSDSLDLGAAGVQADERGNIKVNDRLETNVPGTYALGDTKGGPAFTHIAYDDYRIVAANLLHDGHASIADRIVPYTVYIDPQLGRVGMTEAQARASGRSIKVAKMGMDSVARALEVDESRGFMKAIVDAGSEQVLGAAVLGIEGGEIMSMLQIAMMAKLPYPALRDGVFAHPTLAESLNLLFYSWAD